MDTTPFMDYALTFKVSCAVQPSPPSQSGKMPGAALRQLDLQVRRFLSMLPKLPKLFEPGPFSPFHPWALSPDRQSSADMRRSDISVARVGSYRDPALSPDPPDN